MATEVVATNRTWRAPDTGFRANNIITIGSWSTGVRQLAFDLTATMNPQADIETVDSVTLVRDSDQSAIVISSIYLTQERKATNFDAGPCSPGRYACEVTATLTDAAQVVVRGVLEVS